MTRTLVINSSTPEEELVDINKIILDSDEFNMSVMVYQHNYSAINIVDPKSVGFYVVQFTSISYTLQY